METQHPGGWGWNIHELKADISRKAESHELHTLSSHVDRLECSLRESRAEIDGLRDELQRLERRLMEFLPLENFQ